MVQSIRINDPVTRKQLADLKRKLKLTEDAIVALAIAALWLADGKDAKH